MKRLLLIPSLLLICACSHTQEATWVSRYKFKKGDPKEAIMQRLGAPEQTKKIGDKEIWIYAGPDRYSCQYAFAPDGKLANGTCYATAGTYEIRQQQEAAESQRRAAAWQALSDSAAARAKESNDAFQRRIENQNSQLQQQNYNFQHAQCNPIAPLPPLGCHMACISGAWQSVCP